MILIKTKRFVLRNFKTSDISKNYLSWFKDPKNQFIINKIRNIKQLKKYSISNLNNKNVLFFAIDDPKKNIHIGNLKLERKKKSNIYTIGILIGNSQYQGRGIFKEIFLELKKYIKKKTKITKIRAGIDSENLFSVSAFLKCGFKIVSKTNKKITCEIKL